MGSSLRSDRTHSNHINMKFFILAALVAVAAAVPLEDTMDVKEAKAMFYKAFEEAEMGKLAEKQEMQIPNMYMADSADVAAAKPYLADSADVAAAKAEFMKYFEAREKGIPATPGALEPIQYTAPVHYAAPALTYANPIYSTYAHNYVQPAYTYSNAWAHTAINPYYYAPTTYANILPYAHAIPAAVAVKAEKKE